MNGENPGLAKKRELIGLAEKCSDVCLANALLAAANGRKARAVAQSMAAKRRALAWREWTAALDRQKQILWDGMDAGRYGDPALAAECEKAIQRTHAAEARYREAALIAKALSETKG